MKIGLVLDDTLDTSDGVQQYVIQVGKWLSEQGHDVHYLVGATKRTDIANIHSLARNIRVQFNGNRMSIPLPTGKRKLRQFLLAEQFDVLHIQVPYSPFMAGRLLLAAPRRTAIVGTFHILPYSRLVTLANRGLSLLNHFSGQRFTIMLAVSQPAADFARRIYNYQAEVVPNPVRLSQFNGVHGTSKTLNIVFLGRLVARKGAQELLNAIAYGREHNLFSTPFTVNIGGKGELLPTLQAYVQNHNLSAITTFHGFIGEGEKAAFLASADIAAYPSLGGESFGIVLLEAMAAARGVVLAGDNPGYTSVMKPFPSQLIAPRDTAAFAATLAKFMSSRVARETAAVAQKQYVARFDISVVGQQLLDVYRKALHTTAQS